MNHKEQKHSISAPPRGLGPRTYRLQRSLIFIKGWTISLRQRRTGGYQMVYSPSLCTFNDV